MATGYVTNWGNDSNDGLTWETAKRTFQGASDAGLDPVYGTGIYYTADISNISNVSCDRDELILDGANRSLSYYTAYVYPYISNMTFRNFNINMLSQNGYKFGEISSCTFKDGNVVGRGQEADSTYANYGFGKFNNSIISNVRSVHISDYYSKGNFQNTYHKIDTIFLINAYQNKVVFDKCIISNTKISQPMYGDAEYTLYINVAFKFWNGGLGNDETDYIYPTGATDEEKLQNLRNRMASVYGGVADDYLKGCQYYSGDYNDIFIDADNDNFYLVEGCVASHMTYEGSYVGAKPIGGQTTVDTFTSLQNIDPTTGLIQDQEIDAIAESTIVDLGRVRKITDLIALGTVAARNGQQINTVSNLGIPIDAGTNVLTAGKTYMVINDTIVLDDANATVYDPWDTFTAVDEGSGAGLGFSTGSNGQVQEVYISDYDQKIQIQSSKSDSSLASATTITLYLYETPQVNLDATSGEPIYGNADANFDPANAQPLNSRYIRFFITVKANQLPAR